MPCKVEYAPPPHPPPPTNIRTHFPKCWGASALLRPWFQCSVFKEMYRYAQYTSEPSNGSRLALVVEAGLKADDNWNMKICNNQQYMYFTCTFAL